MAERGLQPEDEHDSSSDEDFNPDAQPAPADISSSEDEPKEGAPKFKRRRVDVEGQDDGLNFENSGDEATIRKGWKKRKDVSESEKDEGGEGGLVKTRAQRRLE